MGNFLYLLQNLSIMNSLPVIIKSFIYISAKEKCSYGKPVSGVIAAIALLLFVNSAANAQKLDVAYVPTPDLVVERMLNMANVGPGDYVIDPGCGDGRIVIAAAKRGAFGHGVDLDPKRIDEARENAEKAGVADKVVFVVENIFDTDFSRASVIAMYLFPDINFRLRPALLDKLEPGSRIVSHDFDMYDWKADKQHGRMEDHAVYLWIVPAKVEGNWKWNVAGEEFKMMVVQKFQELNLTVLSEGIVLNIENSLLSGKRISFMATNPSNGKKYVYSGRAENGVITGMVQIHHGINKTVENWTAVLD
jgi:SAM-dependent methyltransferase